MIKRIIISLILITWAFGIRSCDNCKDALNEREVSAFKIVFIDQNTDQNLFIGDGKIYEESDFQLYYIGSADTLINRTNRNYYFDEEGFMIETSQLTGDNITTFYYRLEDTQPLDTLNISFNEIEDECLGEFKESYNLFLNDELVCDNCKHGDFTIIKK